MEKQFCLPRLKMSMRTQTSVYFIAAMMLSGFLAPILPCTAEPAPSNAPPASVQVQKKIVFTFQVDAVGNKERADALEESLMDKGYPAYIEAVSDNTGKITYQVRIGKYQTREEAENAARAFYAREKKPYWITATELHGVESAPSSIAAPDAAPGSDLQQPPSVPTTSMPMEPGQTSATQAAAPADQKSVTGASPAASQSQAATGTTAVPAAAQPDSNWPATVTRIYTYYDAQGFLRVTNNEKKIPPELQHRIESVSIFPVKYLSFNQKKKLLVLDVAGRQEEVQLAGVDLDTAGALTGTAAYCETALKHVPLRLKFAPEQPASDKKKTVRANLFFKHGASVALELLRQGIAPCDAAGLPPAQKQACLEAEAAARSQRVGIWETPK